MGSVAIPTGAVRSATAGAIPHPLPLPVPDSPAAWGILKAREAKARRALTDRYGSRLASRFMFEVRRSVNEPRQRVAILALAAHGDFAGAVGALERTFAGYAERRQRRWQGRGVPARGLSMAYPIPGVVIFEHHMPDVAWAAGVLDDLLAEPDPEAITGILAAAAKLSAADAADAAEPTQAPPDYQQPPTQLRDVGALLLAPRPGPTAGQTAAASNTP